MAESSYRKRMARLLAEGFTPSQARGHPKSGEPSVREARAQAAASGRTVGSWLRDLLFARPADWRAARTEEPPSSYEPPEPPIRVLPPEELAPPEERGFVTGPTWDDPYMQKAYDFELIDENGQVLDEEGFYLLGKGWFRFQDDEGNWLTFMDQDMFDLADTRTDFFNYIDVSWRDFDDWREYISEYLGAA